MGMHFCQHCFFCIEGFLGNIILSLTQFQTMLRSMKENIELVSPYRFFDHSVKNSTSTQRSNFDAI
jgi:hypothetical protein